MASRIFCSLLSRPVATSWSVHCCLKNSQLIITSPLTVIGEGMGKSDVKEIDRRALPVDELSSGGGIYGFEVFNVR